MRVYADSMAELSNWLVNAFNGEWLKVANPKPNGKRRSLPLPPV